MPSLTDEPERKRKIKCDEAWPTCRRCLVGGRICDGPNRSRYIFTARCKASSPTGAPGTSISLNPQHSIPTGMSQAECDIFDFFLHRAAPNLAGFHDHQLWSLLVPQAALSDPVMRSLVFAISTFYRHPQSLLKGIPPDRLHPGQLQALRWCDRSLAALQCACTDGSHQSDQYLLLSCILLSALQFQQNDVKNAVRLLRAGFSLACDVAERERTPSTELDLLIRAMFRQALLLSIFGCTLPSRQVEICSKYLSASTSEMPKLSFARDQLFACMLQAVTLINSVSATRFKQDGDHHEQAVQLYNEKQRDVLESLARWNCQFGLLCGKPTPDQHSDVRSAISLMIMYYHVSKIWTITCLAHSNTVFDDFNQQFEGILHHAENVIQANSSAHQPFTFEMGVVAPLSFVAAHCRHPILRRRAIALIRKASVREALFTAEHSARAAEILVALEESPHMRNEVETGVWDGSLPGERDRCQYTTQPFDDRNEEQRLPSVHYLLAKQSSAGQLVGWSRHSLPMFSQTSGVSA